MKLLPLLAALPAALLQTAAVPDAGPPASASAPPWPALGEAPGGRWVCDPENEQRRKADLALMQADLPKGLSGAAPDLPQLEAALSHAPLEPVGGIAVCDGRTVGFNGPASLLALLRATHPAATTAGGAPPAAFTVDSRPMPYARLALLVGSLRNASGRWDLAVAALDRGLAVEPDEPELTTEKAYALNRTGRSAEAADICARAIAAAPAAPKIDVARLHRSRGYALGELGRYDEAVAEYRTSQSLDPAETTSAKEIVYLQGRKAGRGVSGVRSLTSDQGRPPG